MTWKDIFTITAAGVGAVLGIINTWNSINQRRLRLRVTPQFLLTPEGSPSAFSIDIINLSSFPVTVAEAGFTLASSKRRIVIHDPSFLDKNEWPRRLGPREAVTICCDFGQIRPPASERLGKAYVRTACGETIFGTSSALKQLATL